MLRRLKIARNLRIARNLKLKKKQKTANDDGKSIVSKSKCAYLILLLNVFLLYLRFDDILKDDITAMTTVKRNVQFTTVPLETLQMAEEQECSCRNFSPVSLDSPPKSCCVRVLVTTHKMGTLLASKIQQDYGWAENNTVALDGIHGRLMPELDAGSTDFRKVFIVRNLYESIISGYLYHKTGRECWLGPNGEKAKISRISRENSWDWDEAFTYKPLPTVKRKKRSICKYLDEENEETGLRVFIEFSLKWYWRKVWSYWSRCNEKQSCRGKVALLCFEDLVNSGRDAKEQAMDSMINFFYPCGYDGQLPESAKENATTDIGHGTSKEPELRSRLRVIIKKLDKEVFNGTIAEKQKIFGCTLP